MNYFILESRNVIARTDPSFFINMSLVNDIWPQNIGVSVKFNEYCNNIYNSNINMNYHGLTSSKSNYIPVPDTNVSCLFYQLQKENNISNLFQITKNNYLFSKLQKDFKNWLFSYPTVFNEDDIYTVHEGILVECIHNKFCSVVIEMANSGIKKENRKEYAINLLKKSLDNLNIKYTFNFENHCSSFSNKYLKFRVNDCVKIDLTMELNISSMFNLYSIKAKDFPELVMNPNYYEEMQITNKFSEDILKEIQYIHEKPINLYINLDNRSEIVHRAKDPKFSKEQII